MRFLWRGKPGNRVLVNGQKPKQARMALKHQAAQSFLVLKQSAGSCTEMVVVLVCKGRMAYCLHAKDEGNPDGEALLLDEGNILFTADGYDVSSPLIPLLFADVTHAPVRKKVAFCRSEPASHVVLIAPRRSAELAQDPEGCQQVWLLCLGKCTDADLSAFLFHLSRRGALRWDVKQCYSINRRCRGIGGQGAVFTGTARTPTGDLQDPRIMREIRGQLTLPGVHDLDQAAVKVWGNGSMAAFRAEVGHLQKMCGHPNISSLLGVFCELGEDSAQRPQWVMVMELCPGGDLFDLVSDGVIPQENVLQIMVGVFSALTYVHANNIVHRDVKAENVVLHGERAVLIDFGIACRMEEAEEMRRRVGSPGYVAPEIIRGKRYNELVDIFAAGVIVYFMLCGRLPFAAEQQETILEKTVKCDVNYGLEAFGRVTPPLLNMVRQMITPNIPSRPSARVCFVNLSTIASRAVRMSEAFRIAKTALAT
ncbi:CPK2 [Symbiodinium pilosum]|uniref:CPK2 protein n=1 Tax=Symbiodinium pilosum TaxID=2952 RepID=A0A812IYL6_SYMPI|nr:CPK2 [Symbiodinium pilosum]